jgi:hypothetical protein
MDLPMATPGLEVKSRARIPIRARESGSTLAAWRLELALPGGPAAIVLADLGSNRAWYRGEGSLLGAPQERLAAIWSECLPTDDPEPDFQQFG